MTNTRVSIPLLMSLVVAMPTAASAATPFAGEDFDGGATNGGFTAATQVFTPDNSGFSDKGTFTEGGSIFDRYGIVSRADNIPFDVQDDSAGNFPPDSMGILENGKIDNVVLLADTENGDNSGPVTAEWTFDISGRSNLELSIDMAMVGDFEAGDDTFEFTYSIDGGPSMSAFSIDADGTNPTVFYGISMEAGGFFDRYFTPFFDEAEWLELTSVGPFNNVTYHPDDNGLDGDTTAQDGFIPIEGLGGVVEERAVQSGDFTDVERLAYKDPLFVNGDATTGTMLTDDFQSLTAALSGTGSTLTLSFSGMTNSNQEFFVFDNILLSEGDGPAAPGDFNGDGAVDAADYTVWRDNLGESEGDLLGGNGTGGTIDADDYDLWVANYGSSFGELAAADAAPEPGALGLGVIGVVAALRRRR
ncbi:hypothetical protein KOR34_25750 [Posidoniimonas corsicana]|uniref:PEP-CTERM protein-sorting domain-containing protein n=1 Tax=Posidoniimonas corsicana TaxID=1938618 RepID=A0A5C5VIC0_9BACT|nr:hypothetical protein [Posidoniimonas corsicana]TWT37619.1 hypothetical protein KOR34_25750 [Posidoniimonas corsicana]